ncbi:DUF4258 domain-containing protein [Coleofasciculus sp. E1-EBD-02]|jgi:hypothetical protein|uniref:DUF4258 domain-containing protein n=1 Tax=Coleofasciculus sp. E1-EBD-02 TaxID=3068481 RepID=UPI004064406F
MSTKPDYILTEHARARMLERNIQQEWIERTLSNPDLLELDSEDSTKRHAFKTIPEYGDRVLRVIYNPNYKPWIIISVYFDRKRKGTL